ncbi:MAG TPA: GntR family transcriptional regulator [Thermomicrobiales bacterium]|nr:GntR family transcriptional regulator [Thermomicrobiales bacterium]
MASLTPLQAKRAPRFREAAYKEIKAAILDGRFAPSQPILEEELAEELRVSRTPVREALAILQHEGLLASRNGRGLYVRPLTRAEFVAMFSANEVIEPYLVRRAALLATDEQIVAMRATLDREEACVKTDDMAAFFKIGREFHRLVGEACGNLPLTRFVIQNEERTDLYLLGRGESIGVRRMTASNEEHREILAAIARRDPDAAAQLAIVHSQLIRRRLADLFEDAAPAPEDE